MALALLRDIKLNKNKKMVDICHGIIGVALFI